MKKSFFRSFVLSAFLALLSENVFAKQAGDGYNKLPTVTIGGFINSNAGYRTQDSTYDKKRLPDAQSNAGVVNNATGTQNKMNNNPDFTNEAEIHIKVAGVSDYGMKYGAIVELEANTSTTSRNEGVNADKAYIFTESQIGKWEFGNNSSVNHKMKVGPASFARGAGGINGKYLEYINLPMLANSSQMVAGTAVCGVGTTVSNTSCQTVKLPSFILIPQSPIAHGGYARGFYSANNNLSANADLTTANAGNTANVATDNGAFNSAKITTGQFGDLEDASKVNYYTPRMAGFQFGATFTPDTANNTASTSGIGNASGDIKQAISYGLNYSDNLGNFGVAFSATGEMGKFKQNAAAITKRDDLKAYDVGMVVTFFGATVGVSYGNWGSSLQPNSGIYSCDYDPTKSLAAQNCIGVNGSKKFSDAAYYTAGANYQIGPFATSLTYLNSNFQENKYTAISLGVDYKMAKGLMPYVEITKYDFVSNQPKANNVAKQDGSSGQLRDNAGYVALAGLLFSF